MPSSPRTCEILILGAGPAGCAVALGLARLGYDVVVVSQWRHFNAIEGISKRTLHGLEQAGLRQAAKTAMAATDRIVIWNGQETIANQEHLVDRQRFDQALRHDLSAASVRLVAGRVIRWHIHATGHEVEVETETDSQIWRTDFVIEARGRQAPALAQGLRGPEALSLLHSWRTDSDGRLAAGVESLPNGWAWMAHLPDGRCYWQWTMSPRHNPLPPRAQIAAATAALRQSSLSQRILGTPVDGSSIQVHARSNTTTLCQATGGPHWLRVGDAALAADSLSGNGIFQVLSSALQAPAIVHTLLQRPADASLALAFHQQRAEHLGLRFARTGRDFYAAERRWATAPFWQERAKWPDDQPLHQPAGLVRTAMRPVIDDHYIRLAEVVVTDDQPLGMWRVADIELAGLVHQLQQHQADPALNGRWLRERLQQTAPDNRAKVLGWLQTHGMLPAAAA
jgi:flavin-dependent dehydrogenase